MTKKYPHTNKSTRHDKQENVSLRTTDMTQPQNATWALNKKLSKTRVKVTLL